VILQVGQSLVARVVTNLAGKTPGIHKQLWDSPSKRLNAIESLRDILNKPKEYRSQPLLRVSIPNTNELSLQGIPTLTDRAVQAVYQMAVDPIVEQQSDHNSYGFTVYLSTHDAITLIFSIMDKNTSPNWVLNANVAKSLNKISHDFMIEKTMICDKAVLEQWLKSGVMETGILKQTNIVTPQPVGISSMLCNIALNGLETALKQAAWAMKRGERSKVHLTLYADDFVCIGISHTVLENQIKEGVSAFLAERGLDFKDSKSEVVSINQGFNFLGFTFQRKPWNYKFNKISKHQKTVLIVEPQKAKVLELKGKLKKTILLEKPI
jgi:RNA-directed DNA polymerase